ncbi:MAG: ATP-binding protein [Pirellulales bacterium]
MLLIVEWVALVFVAAVVTPRAWLSSQSSNQHDVWFAVYFGGLIIMPTLALVRWAPATAKSRHAAAVSQSLVSGMLIYLTDGRIESHFHIFGSLACLSLYRDWRVLLTASAVTAVDHAIRGIYWPASVFGIVSIEHWRWLEHLGWMLFEDFFLVLSCRLSLREMSEIARREADACNEALRLEQQIDERTLALRMSEQELRETCRTAEAASIAKSEFLANMSHEIRTPMAAILGYADLLMELGDIRQAPNPRVEAIDTIRRNGRHLLALINDMLDLSRIESGKLSFEQVECSPVEIVREVEGLMRGRAEGKGIGLSCELQTPIPTTIKNDPTRLRQVLVNLVGNAVKFTEQGEVRIEARYLGDESRLEVDVVDTGIGIDADVQARLFQPFVQADSSTTRRFGGTGLGLAISRRLAEMFGGGLSFVSSEPGVGTRVRLTIPCCVVGTEMTDEFRLAAAVAPPVQDAAPQTLVGIRVLVAEDGPDNQRLILHYLKKAGADVTLVDNGRAAVDTVLAADAAGAEFDVVLMDMQMPIMGGYEATSLLRSLGYEVPVIAATAHAMSGDREKCLAAGCNDYVTKPFEREVLLRTIGEHARAALHAAGRSAGTS